jgi:phospholipid/cholesterol/gamma-HCH transport system substrate-binding protein
VVQNEVKIGIAIVAAVLIGFVGFRIMRDVPIFKLGTVIYSTYDKVDGLTTGSPIIISGIKIGSVRGMEILPNDSVRVTLNINLIDGVPKGSVAYIRATDLLGSKAVIIQRTTNPEFIPADGQIQGIYDEGAFAGMADVGKGIGQNVNQSTESLKSVLSQVDQLLVNGGKNDLAGILRNLNETTNDIQQVMDSRQAQIKTTIRNIESMTTRLDRLTADEEANIREAINHLKSASGEIDDLMSGLTETNKQLGEILTKINEGEGSLGLLVNDPSLYRNLDSLSFNLNKTIEKLNDNPKYYLRHLRLIRVF